MKMSYDPETDIVMCRMARGRIDHAEERGPMIAHFDRKDHLLLLEIQGASKFAGNLVRLTLQTRGRKSQTITI